MDESGTGVIHGSARSVETLASKRSCSRNAPQSAWFESRTKKSPAESRPGFWLWRGSSYCAMRSFDRLVPIWLKIVPICEDDVTRKNLLVSVAQFCSSVEVGSPSVFTWIV